MHVRCGQEVGGASWTRPLETVILHRNFKLGCMIDWWPGVNASIDNDAYFDLDEERLEALIGTREQGEPILIVSTMTSYSLPTKATYVTYMCMCVHLSDC